MTKKLPHALLIPAISLLPLTQGAALPKENHFVEKLPQQLSRQDIRAMVIPGKQFNAKTIQVNSAYFANAKKDQISVITTLDQDGNKKRFILLGATRSQFGIDLMQQHGRLKEFDLYSIVDENGAKANFLASKRIVSAPANELTVLFDTPADAKQFFTRARTQELARNNIFVVNPQTMEAPDPYAAVQTYLQNEKAKFSCKDHSKGTGIEPVEFFPSKVLIAADISVYHNTLKKTSQED